LKNSEIENANVLRTISVGDRIFVLYEGVGHVLSVFDSIDLTSTRVDARYSASAQWFPEWGIYVDFDETFLPTDDPEKDIIGMPRSAIVIDYVNSRKNSQRFPRTATIFDQLRAELNP